MPVEWFRNPSFATGLLRRDAHPDGKRFLLAEPDETQASPSIHVILNWPVLLREKATQ